MLVEHGANPNLIIPERKIAAIHYAAGMENTAFAESAMKLILKCNGTNNFIFFALFYVNLICIFSEIKVIQMFKQ